MLFEHVFEAHKRRSEAYFGCVFERRPPIVNVFEQGCEAAWFRE
jgi:hypothetical protein